MIAPPLCHACGRTCQFAIAVVVADGLIRMADWRCECGKTTFVASPGHNHRSSDAAERHSGSSEAPPSYRASAVRQVRGGDRPDTYSAPVAPSVAPRGVSSRTCGRASRLGRFLGDHSRRYLGRSAMRILRASDLRSSFPSFFDAVLASCNWPASSRTTSPNGHHLASSSSVEGLR